ncbi:MAG: hypothetical protein KJI72_00085 [Patescibacteria group bacterium]|nr:hypothetical protein [Patescibacteria group bacterium]
MYKEIIKKYLIIVITIFLFGFAAGMLVSIPFRPDPEIIVKEKPCTLNQQILDVIRTEETLKSQLCIRNGQLPDRSIYNGEFKGCVPPPEGF